MRSNTGGRTKGQEESARQRQEHLLQMEKAPPDGRGLCVYRAGPDRLPVFASHDTRGDGQLHRPKAQRFARDPGGEFGRRAGRRARSRGRIAQFGAEEVGQQRAVLAVQPLAQRGNLVQHRLWWDAPLVDRRGLVAALKK